MDTIIEAITDNILIPVIAILGTTLVLIIENCLKKITESIVNKNAMSDLEKEAATRKKLIDTISSYVDSAVASNMQLADFMKSDGSSLTDAQIKTLNEGAKKIIYAALPTSLTEEDGTLMKIIGGPEKLEALIDAMMEKCVYEYKLKKNTVVQVVNTDDIENRIIKVTTLPKASIKISQSDS